MSVLGSCSEDLCPCCCLFDIRRLWRLQELWSICSEHGSGGWALEPMSDPGSGLFYFLLSALWWREWFLSLALASLNWKHFHAFPAIMKQTLLILWTKINLSFIKFFLSGTMVTDIRVMSVCMQHKKDKMELTKIPWTRCQTHII